MLKLKEKAIEKANKARQTSQNILDKYKDKATEVVKKNYPKNILGDEQYPNMFPINSSISSFYTGINIIWSNPETKEFIHTFISWPEIIQGEYLHRYSKGVTKILT